VSDSEYSRRLSITVHTELSGEIIQVGEVSNETFGLVYVISVFGTNLKARFIT
jgi:hypothetical protein